MDLATVYRKNDNFVEKVIGNETVLVPITNNIADMNSVFTLNEVGTFIYTRIDNIKSLGEILSELTAEYEVADKIAQNDLSEFIKLALVKEVIIEQ